MNIDIDKINIALETKEKLIKELEEEARERKEKIETIDIFLESQYDLIDKSFKDGFEPEIFEINDKIYRVKNIVQKVNTEDLAEVLKNKLSTSLGKKGQDIWHFGMEQGSKISYNKVNFIKGMKETLILLMLQ